MNLLVKKMEPELKRVACVVLVFSIISWLFLFYNIQEDYIEIPTSHCSYCRNFLN